jgi:hypothetical protein
METRGYGHKGEAGAQAAHVPSRGTVTIPMVQDAWAQPPGAGGSRSTHLVGAPTLQARLGRTVVAAPSVKLWCSILVAGLVSATAMALPHLPLWFRGGQSWPHPGSNA